MDDYKLHLIVPKEIEDFKLFRSEFGKVMHYIAVSKSKQGIAALQNVDEFCAVGNDTVRLINECIKSNIRIDEEKGVTDMCQGLQVLLNDEREVGLEQGRMDMIQRLIAKGKSKEEIIDLLDVSDEEYEKADGKLYASV